MAAGLRVFRSITLRVSSFSKGRQYNRIAKTQEVFIEGGGRRGETPTASAYNYPIMSESKVLSQRHLQVNDGHHNGHGHGRRRHHSTSSARTAMGAWPAEGRIRLSSAKKTARRRRPSPTAAAVEKGKSGRKAASAAALRNFLDGPKADLSQEDIFRRQCVDLLRQLTSANRR